MRFFFVETGCCLIFFSQKPLWVAFSNRVGALGGRGEREGGILDSLRFVSRLRGNDCRGSVGVVRAQGGWRFEIAASAKRLLAMTEGGIRVDEDDPRLTPGG